ncbi:unnamed protein product [Prunus armeniaca]
MVVTIYVNSDSPCKGLVVFPSIVIATIIHMRYEERNLYRVLVWEFFSLLTSANPGNSQAVLAFWPTQARGAHKLPRQLKPAGTMKWGLGPFLP